MNSVPKTVTDELQALHKDFIWNGRKAKIKHSTLIGDFRDGGLRDVEIPSCFETAKVSWIRTFFDDNFHLWKIVAEGGFEGIGSKMLFHPNLKLSEHFYNAGIQKIGQLYKEQGRAKSWRELTEEYNLHVGSYMVWLSMSKSIPRTWKDILKHQENENDLSGLISLEGLEGTLYSKLSSKAIYKALVANVFQRPSAQDTIQKRTDRNIDWRKAYMISRKCTIDSHTRIFQYKILNNILYLNDRLFKMNLVESQMCSFCIGEKETVEHLFLNCRIAKNTVDKYL